MAREVVWLIVKPGYGEFDGMPVALLLTRRRARLRLQDLNQPGHISHHVTDLTE